MEMYTERQAYDPSRDVTMLVSETTLKFLCIMTYKTIAVIPLYLSTSFALMHFKMQQNFKGFVDLT